MKGHQGGEGLEHLALQERLGSWDCWARRRGGSGDLTRVLWRGSEEELGSAWWCPVPGLETTGRNWNMLEPQEMLVPCESDRGAPRVGGGVSVLAEPVWARSWVAQLSLRTSSSPQAGISLSCPPAPWCPVTAPCFVP